MFSIGICPITDNISIRFYEWYYFISLMLMNLYFALTFQKVLNESQLNLESKFMIKLEEPRKTSVLKSDNQADTSQNYLTPLRRFFGDLPPLVKMDSNKTLDGSNMEQVLSKRQKKIKYYYSTALWSGVSFGTLLIAYYLFAIYYLFGHEKGLIQSIVVSVGIILTSHFFFGGLGLSPIKWTRNQSITSYIFGVSYIITIILAVVLSGDFSIYVSAYLWPVCTILVACDPSRNNPDKSKSLINPGILDTPEEFNSENRFGDLKNEVSSNVKWIFFRYLALSSIFGSFFISLCSGLYLPLSLMLVIIAVSIAISGYLPTNRWWYLLAHGGALVVFIVMSMIVAFITPLFWGRSINDSGVSTSFVQIDQTPSIYSNSLTESQGIYIKFHSAKQRAGNLAEFKLWLDSLPSVQNRIFFDIDDDLLMMKSLGSVRKIIR